MSPLCEYHLSALVKTLQSVLTNSLKHGEGRFLPLLLAMQQEALIEQSPHDVQRRYSPWFCLIAQFAYSPRLLQSESTDEDREAAEEPLFLGRKQIIAPRDGVAQRLLTCWYILCSARQHR